ncbi:MAG: hypothetical protein LBQ54_00490 [Planctomycetaceae bacterium]|nr:hypothetical protein [Planctomycetaceae bacterium]
MTANVARCIAAGKPRRAVASLSLRDGRHRLEKSFQLEAEGNPGCNIRTLSAPKAMNSLPMVAGIRERNKRKMVEKIIHRKPTAKPGGYCPSRYTLCDIQYIISICLSIFSQ